MSCGSFSLGDSVVHRLDPRGRVLAAAALSVVAALAAGWATMAAALAVAVLLAALARLPLGGLLRRMAPVNAFVLAMWLLLPLTGPGASLRPLSLSAEGCRLAAAVTLKANAVVLTFTALVATMEPVAFGHALHHLRVPDKLAHLLLFTIRYVDVLAHERLRLARAMKVRCFRPRVSLHTYRSIAHVVGMLLVHSFDRSERVLAAMKCRGFRGKFHLLDHFRAGPRDAVFAAAAGAALAGLAALEYLT